MSMKTTAAKWYGWHRRSKRERWVQLSQADDYGICLNKLLDAVAGLGGGELLVSERDPNKDWSKR